MVNVKYLLLSADRKLMVGHKELTINVLYLHTLKKNLYTFYTETKPKPIL